MGKRIISQARGHGSLTYRVRRKAFKHRIKYPNLNEGKGKVIKLISSAGHSAPLAKIQIGKEIFYNPAAKNLFEGQEIEINGKNESGNIVMLKKVPVGTKVFNIEIYAGDGGRLVRSGGNSAIITKREKGKVKIMLPSKKEIAVDAKARATIGEIAGAGRIDKPIIKAGKQHYIKKSRNKFWPRTSAVKMNVVDHPFGGGRGKRIKSKIAKRNAPPGARVGLLRPRRTGRRRG